MSVSRTPNDSLAQSLAADPKAMSNLSAKIASDPKGAVHDVAQQFEAMFMNTLLKTMRETHFDDSEQSSEMQTYRGLLDEQMIQSLSAGSGMGLSRMLEQQIGKIAHLSDDATTPVDPATLSPLTGSSASPVPVRALRAYQAALAHAGIHNPSLDAAIEAAGAGGATGAALPSTEDSAAAGGARGFVQTLLPHAAPAADQLGVAPEVLVAHAALESGWGRRAIRNADGSDSHNLFGIKAGSDWRGATTSVMTTEYVNGVPQKKVDTFRSYPSYREAFADYANLLSTSSRYRNVLNQGRNIRGFAMGLQSGGYATDPRYARKLMDVMSSLAQYIA